MKSDNYCFQLTVPYSSALAVYELIGDFTRLFGRKLTDTNPKYLKLQLSDYVYDDGIVEIRTYGSGLSSAIISLHGGSGSSSSFRSFVESKGFKFLDYQSRIEYQLSAGIINQVQYEASKLLLTANSPVQSLYLSAYKNGKLPITNNKDKSGIYLANGINVSIVGMANSGKSSLFNRLVSKERSIVSAHEGTTLDVVNQYVEIQGYPFQFFDCPGFLDSPDQLDTLSMIRAIEYIRKSDLVIYLHDATMFKEYKFNIPAGLTINVLNKIDIKTIHGDFDVCISALTGENIDELINVMFSRLLLSNTDELLINNSVFTQRQFNIINSTDDIDEIKRKLIVE